MTLTTAKAAIGTMSRTTNPRADDDERSASAKSAATRRRILDAAALVLGRKGFSGTRLADIAKVADMQAGSIYYHFASREELVAEVMATGVNHTFETVRQALEALPSDATAVQRLRTAIETHLLCLIENSDYARAVSKLSGQVPGAIQAQHLANEQAYGALWKRLLREARERREIRGDLNLSAVRMLILGAMSWSIEWYKPENGPARHIAHDLAEMILNGLTTGTPSSPRPG